MDKQVIEKNPVLRRAFDFSLLINKFSERPKADKRYTISRQLLRSGTSVCANAIEAQDAESMADFIHTFKVAAKEETAYCLLLCEYS